MANNENLTIFSPSEARANGKKGGEKKAENAKLRKTFADLGQAMVDAPLKQEDLEKIKDEFPGLDLEEITNRTLMLQSQIKKAKLGDSKAFEVVRDTIGEKPTDKRDVAHSGYIANYSVCPATQAAAKKARENREKIDE